MMSEALLAASCNGLVDRCVTYINATLSAPSNYSCNESGVCNEVGIESLANISAVVKEPLNKKGNKFREMICTPQDASVTLSN